MTPRHRKGQLELYLLGGVGIAVFLAIVAFLVVKFAGGNTLSAANPSCTDFQPAGATCTADADCVSALVPPGENLSDNIELRCNAGACELRVVQCGVVEP